MRVSHFHYVKPAINPTLLTTDFGEELVVIPSARCVVHWDDVYATQIVNEDAWLSLFALGDREEE